jgi:probable rRNA maturation factor|tara:strand:- start:123 stop:590 length:468 start_codon:yes stop_codon:yes gene_type:complete
MINAKIVIDNVNWEKKLKKIELFFNKVLESFPKKYQFGRKKVVLTVLLSGNKKIKQLNKKFRKKNKPTDILSFPFKKKVSKNMTYLGDIIISYDYMNKTKSSNIYEFKDKVAKIFIHGFLHLVGFDHVKMKEFKKMNKEESKIYKLVKKKIENFT